MEEKSSLASWEKKEEKNTMKHIRYIESLG